MTRFRAVVITDNAVTVKEFDNGEKAELFEYKMRNTDLHLRVYSHGDINGEQYTIVYILEERKDGVDERTL